MSANQPARGQRLVYIAGAGRSGSTLLEIILGNLPGFFSVGEIRYFWERLDLADGWCGCGSQLRKCEFWGAVASDLEATGLDLDRMRDLAAGLVRTRNVFAFLPGALFSDGPAYLEYQEGLARLYEVVAKHAGADILIDSSKTPTYLKLIRSLPGLDLRILHLVRDGRAVAYSWSKRGRVGITQAAEPGGALPVRRPLKALLIWMLENLLTLLASRTVPYTRLRYEDFVAGPRASLEQACAGLGLQADLRAFDQDSPRFAATHSVGGNPMRYALRGVKIQLDDQWRQDWGFPMRIFLTMAGSPALLGLGYPPW